MYYYPPQSAYASYGPTYGAVPHQPMVYVPAYHQPEYALVNTSLAQASLIASTRPLPQLRYFPSDTAPVLAPNRDRSSERSFLEAIRSTSYYKKP